MKSRESSSWPAAHVAYLRELHGLDHSASQIARAINVKFGVRVSRNAAIGKLHRLGLTGVDAPRRKRRHLSLRIVDDNAISAIGNSGLGYGVPPLRRRLGAKDAERLKGMFGRNYTVGAIAAELGFSASTIIQKIKLLRLKRAPRAILKSLAITARADDPPPPAGHPYRMSAGVIEIPPANLCHWPYGEIEDGSFAYCGALIGAEAAELNRSYCAAHWRRMWLKARKPRARTRERLRTMEMQAMAFG